MPILINEAGIYINDEKKVAFPNTLQDLGNLKYLSLQELFQKPFKGKVLFEKVSPSSFRIPTGFKYKVNNTFIELTENITVDITTSLDTGSVAAGTDYYIYAKEDKTFFVSANKTLITARLIGGFHYGLTPTNEAPTGNKTEADMVMLRGINAYSFWDLKFMPKNGIPEAKVFKNGLWADIYRGDVDYSIRGYSKSGTVIAGGATTNGRGLPKIPTRFGGDNSITYGKLSWLEATDIANAVNMRKPTYAEFSLFAYGVVENVSVTGGVTEKVQGRTQHYPELMSALGIEQATGEQYCWSDNIVATDGTWVEQDVANGRGKIYASAGNPKAGIFGGHRGYAFSGSSCSGWGHHLWYSHWYIGFWFVVDHLELD